ncbi:hypothetical protein FHG64_14020 [Antarcticibacterium flavum]|uniref:YdhG-like domain-containing protein n=1 Tax=Antarcticibacterium flavum TaxID=2058175 RepID=A0A5B7X6Q8_9FLAO|nr:MULTISPECIES: DUF1801 domain-containing protein [Antarcticibacterium]MCM4159975.1 hypothetical protein [Antarcticibacterium sp. W02-3]QCY70432.1 hypothetical protein FHG64_14020 [Antarcticibacterium flavum]
MAKITSVEEYLEAHPEWSSQLEKLRNLLNTFPLKETIKWGAPVYTYKGKNLIGLAGFKNHYALWFFQGSLLQENTQLLHNAQEGKTQTLRQIRFNSQSEPDLKLLGPYIQEMVEILDRGIIPPKATIKKLIIIPEFLEIFRSQQDLEGLFTSLPVGKQREYISYISEAKRAETKKSRLEKIIPLIREGKGLNDKYRKD